MSIEEKRIFRLYDTNSKPFDVTEKRGLVYKRGRPDFHYLLTDMVEEALQNRYDKSKDINMSSCSIHLL